MGSNFSLKKKSTIVEDKKNETIVEANKAKSVSKTITNNELNK
jgi:hypothetical protein